MTITRALPVCTLRRASAASLLLIAPLLLCAGSAPPDPADALRQARTLVRHGRYDAAASLLDRLLADQPANPDALIARAEVALARGNPQTAETLLARVPPDDRTRADWQRTMARLDESRGRYDDACNHLRRALTIAPDDLAARRMLGDLLILLARYDEAARVLEPFEHLVRAGPPDDAHALVHIGVGYYRYSLLTRPPDLPRRTRFVLHDILQHAYLRVDRDCWEARLEAGRLLAEKHNTADATEELEAALKINPAAEPLHLALARVALDEWEFEKTEKHIRAALATNPRSASARALLAALRLEQRRPADALRAAREALEDNPYHIDALAYLAAAALLLGREDDARTARETVERLARPCPRFHFILGEVLGGWRQFEPAADHYRQAIDAAPWWVEPLAALGRMHMQDGREDLARRLLERAWNLDPFDVRTANTRQLLERLDAFDTLTTPHFVIRFNARTDPAIGHVFAPFLEALHDELCTDYDVTLDRPTIVEVFDSHTSFGVRITAQPWIHTIGACTGPVIALDAPRPTTGFGRRFNWADVLRHEFTHTVTLAATANRIPHWLTEGLAVWQEDLPRSWPWMRLLAGALRRERLFDLRDLDWGFMRPRSPAERPLAYAQSEWVVEFLVARFGYDVLDALLARLRDGLAWQQALPDVTGLSLDDFQRAFLDWARDQVRTWGLPADPLPSRTALQARRQAAPDEPTALALLAEHALLEADFDTAADLAGRALERDPDNAPALELLIRALARDLEDLTAIRAADLPLPRIERLASRLRAVQPDNRLALKLLAQFAEQAGRTEQARALFEHVARLQPADDLPLRRLAAIALEQDAPDDAAAWLRQLWRVSRDDPDIPRTVARIARQRNQPAEAVTWLRHALHVDPYDTQTFRDLAELAEQTRQWPLAGWAWEALGRLDPARRSSYFARAAVCYEKGGQPGRARELAAPAPETRP